MAKQKINGDQLGTTGGAYTAFTPTWTNLTVGNATQIARYSQIGKNVKGYIFLTLGSTSSVGTIPTVTLPVTASSNIIPASDYATIGQIRMNAGGTMVNGITLINTSGIILPVVLNAAGTYATDNGLTATVPATWATGNYIRITFEYEAA